MATSAQYTATPGYSTAVVTTAETSFTPALTNLATILTGPSTAAGSGVGYRIYKASFVVRGSSVAGALRFFTSTDNGTTLNFIGDASIILSTSNTSNEVWKTDVQFLNGIVVPGATGGNAFKIYMAVTTTQTVVSHIWYGAM